MIPSDRAKAINAAIYEIEQSTGARLRLANSITIDVQGKASAVVARRQNSIAMKNTGNCGTTD
jgi:hypothetical protein